jgi:hypothetical protein
VGFVAERRKGCPGSCSPVVNLQTEILLTSTCTNRGAEAPRLHADAGTMLTDPLVETNVARLLAEWSGMRHCL